MFHAQKPALRTTVIMSDVRARDALVAELCNDSRLRLIAQFGTLSDAYAPSEATPPDIVVCSKDIALQEEFPMFNALIGGVGGKVISVSSSSGAASVMHALGLPDLRNQTPPRPFAPAGPERLVAIGASTGGILALSQILSEFPANCPPTMIVQHIKPEFLDSVVARLDRGCAADVRTVRDGQKLKSGQVVFAAGEPCHLELDPHGLRCRVRAGAPVSGHRPSIDVLFHSVAALGTKAVGVILTGMGRDGAIGLEAMRRAGAWTIGQDAATSTVFGMPRVAQESQAVCEVLPLPRIGKAILTAAAKPYREVTQ